MVARFRSRRKNARKLLAVIGIIAVLVVVIALIFVEARVYGTGFAGKTLWDWLQLLIIPLVLAVAALLFNLATTRTEHKNCHATLRARSTDCRATLRTRPKPRTR